MRFVIQRVTEAAVRVDGELLGQIEKGYLVLIGVAESDTEEIADKMVKKMIGLRIFEDEQGKTNLALKDVGGSLLLVSQFTLYANCKKGNRPSFTEAGSPGKANALYEYIIKKCKESVELVETGRFGADMKVSLLNDGPFITIIRDFLDFSFRVVYIYDCVRFWTQCAVLAQSVARRLGKAEVGGSSPLDSFELNPRKCLKMRCFRGFFLLKITIRRKSVGYFARS